MDSLEVMIEQAKDAREVKRAVSVKMGLSGLAPAQICRCLQVSPQYHEFSQKEGLPPQLRYTAALGF